MTHTEAEFLKGLAQLTLKHGIAIGGCGCCGSPWLRKLEAEERAPEYGYAVSSSFDFSAEYLTWTKEEEE
jgi:hypothetical protein